MTQQIKSSDITNVSIVSDEKNRRLLIIDLPLMVNRPSQIVCEAPQELIDRLVEFVNEKLANGVGMPQRQRLARSKR